MKLKEIIFIVEEDPEGGYTAQALGYSIFTEGERMSGGNCAEWLGFSGFVAGVSQGLQFLA